MTSQCGARLRRPRGAWAVALTTLLWAAPFEVRAQQPVDRATQGSQPGGRAYQGLFGQQPVVSQGEALTFVGSLSGGYDENVFAGSGTSGSATRQEAGWIGVATGQLVYQRNSSRQRLEAGAVGGLQYSPTFEDDFARNGSVFADFARDLTTRWSVGLSGRAGYRDRLRFAQVPDGGGGAPLPPAGSDGDIEGEGSIAERPSVIYGGGGNVSYRMSPRGTFTALAHASHVDYLDDDQQQDIWSAGARYRYRVTSYFSADAGYGYREGNYARGVGPDQVSRSHSILAGGDYSRPLSPSRRTYLTLGIGSAIYSRDRAVEDQDSLYRVIGNARLTHDFGQSWQFTAGYRRGVQWLFYSPEPVFVDNVDVTLAGYFSPRWSLSVLSFYSNGQLAATARARPLDRFGNTVRLQYAMTQRLAAFAQYIYYYYLTDPVTAAQLGIAPEYDRNGFRIGLTTFVPLMR